MKRPYAILLSIILFASACQKSGSVTNVVTPLDSTKIDSPLQVAGYPFIDTFYGGYSETNPEIAPYNFSGYSTVLVHHISADSIVFDAQSLGLPHGNMLFSDIINIPEHVSAANSYAFSVQWYNDRWDKYTCSISHDTLQCTITQSTANAASYGIYNGSYTGLKK